MSKTSKPGKPSLFTTFFLAGAVIMFWRGAWGLMDLYILPNTPEISYFVSLVISGMLLLLLGRHRINELI